MYLRYPPVTNISGKRPCTYPQRLFALACIALLFIFLCQLVTFVSAQDTSDDDDKPNILVPDFLKDVKQEEVQLVEEKPPWWQSWMDWVTRGLWSAGAPPSHPVTPPAEVPKKNSGNQEALDQESEKGRNRDTAEPTTKSPKRKKSTRRPRNDSNIPKPWQLIVTASLSLEPSKSPPFQLDPSNAEIRCTACKVQRPTICRKQRSYSIAWGVRHLHHGRAVPPGTMFLVETLMPGGFPRIESAPLQLQFLAWRTDANVEIRSLKDTMDRLQALRDQWKDGSKDHEVCLRAEMGDVLEHLLDVSLMVADRWKRLGLAGGVATPYAPDDPSGNVDRAKLTDQRDSNSLKEGYATDSKNQTAKKVSGAEYPGISSKSGPECLTRQTHHPLAYFPRFSSLLLCRRDHSDQPQSSVLQRSCSGGGHIDWSAKTTDLYDAFIADAMDRINSIEENLKRVERMHNEFAKSAALFKEREKDRVVMEAEKGLVDLDKDGERIVVRRKCKVVVDPNGRRVGKGTVTVGDSTILVPEFIIKEALDGASEGKAPDDPWRLQNDFCRVGTGGLVNPIFDTVSVGRSEKSRKFDAKRLHKCDLSHHVRYVSSLESEREHLIASGGEPPSQATDDLFYKTENICEDIEITQTVGEVDQSRTCLAKELRWLYFDMVQESLAFLRGFSELFVAGIIEMDELDVDNEEEVEGKRGRTLGEERLPFRGWQERMRRLRLMGLLLGGGKNEA